MIVTTADLCTIAYGKYAIGAYNLKNLEQAQGFFTGCLESQAPSIIQLSKGARKYADKGMLDGSPLKQNHWKSGNYINDGLSKELKASLGNRRVDREHQHVQRAGWGRGE